MDDAMMLPAPDTSLAWVYEGATPAMTPSEAATAIQAATLGWTQQDHLEMGALQHHLAVGLGDDPERQAVCSAAAYMHVAAAGLNPGSLLNKGLDPKVLRPKLGTKPVQIGKTRSGKPIYNMFTHPAHASFTTADHVDHIDAMAAHSKAKKMNKAGTPPKLSIVQHAGPKTPSGHPILHSKHPSYAHPIYNHRAKDGTNWGDEEKVKHQTLKDFPHYSAADHDAAHAHHHALGLKQKAAGGEHFQAGLKSSGIGAGHQLAASHLRGLQKIKENPDKSSEWHAGQMGGLRNGNQEHFESHRAASIHLRGMGKSVSGTISKSGEDGREHKVSVQNKHQKLNLQGCGPHAALEPIMYKSEAVSILEDFLSKSGEGSRGGKVISHTRSGKPIYESSHSMYRGIKHKDQDRHSLTENSARVHAMKHHANWTANDHYDAARAHQANAVGDAKSNAITAAHYVAGDRMRDSVSKNKSAKSMSKSGIMGFPVDLGDMQGSPIDGSYVDTLGGSHDLFMQQAELANCPTMWAPIATVPEN